jgi:hypothetical protein
MGWSASGWASVEFKEKQRHKTYHFWLCADHGTANAIRIDHVWSWALAHARFPRALLEGRFARGRFSFVAVARVVGVEGIWAVALGRIVILPDLLAT